MIYAVACFSNENPSSLFHVWHWIGFWLPQILEKNQGSCLPWITYQFKIMFVHLLCKCLNPNIPNQLWCLLHLWYIHWQANLRQSFQVLTFSCIFFFFSIKTSYHRFWYVIQLLSIMGLDVGKLWRSSEKVWLLMNMKHIDLLYKIPMVLCRHKT